MSAANNAADRTNNTELGSLVPHCIAQEEHELKDSHLFAVDVRGPSQKFPFWGCNELKIIFKIPRINCEKTIFPLQHAVMQLQIKHNKKPENYLQIILAFSFDYFIRKSLCHFKIDLKQGSFGSGWLNTPSTLFNLTLSLPSKHSEPPPILILNRSFILYFCQRNFQGMEKAKQRLFISCSFQTKRKLLGWTSYVRSLLSWQRRKVIPHETDPPISHLIYLNNLKRVQIFCHLKVEIVSFFI